MRSTLKPDRVALLRPLSILILFSLLAFTSAFALDPSRSISQYAHSVWKSQDGLLKGVPSSIAQTTDGYLWIGTMSGLMRFDGVQFTSWPPPNGKQLPSAFVTSLLGARDGSLWIGTDLGLSHWVNQDLVNYPETREAILGIVEDGSGKIWFSQVEIYNSVGAICTIINPGTHCYGKTDGVTVTGGPLVQDSLGNLWSGDPTRLLRWKPGSSSTLELSGLKSNAGRGVAALAYTPDGSLWVGMQKTGSGLGLQQLKQGKWKAFVTTGFDSSALVVTSLLSDRENSLWVGTGGDGLYRIRGREIDHFRSADGLSSDGVNALFEDREGNIWVATNKGIDSFHEIRVTSFSPPPGVGSDEVDAVVARRDGTIWVGRPQSLDTLREDKLSSLQTGKGLPGNQVTSLFEDHAGKFWVGIDKTLSIYESGRFHGISRADGSPIGVVVGITEDVENDVWAETIGPPRTLLRIRDFRVREEFPAPQMPAARKVEADPTGGIWLGLLSGDLARYRHGKIEIFSYPHDSAKPFVRQLTVNPDGSVLGATPTGLIAWKNGKQQTLTIRNGLPCDSVFAQILDKRGDLWMYADCGLIKITNAELQRWWDRSDTKLQMKVFDSFDGVHPGFAYFGGAARTPDGRLWFVNGVGLQMIDPAHTAVNTTPPPVQIEEVIADRKNYSPVGDIRLPPLTRNLEIDYAGLSFVIPQKVRFRYKLEGHDVDWQEPGTRRQAFYSDLRPGGYRFHVVACNNDGIWNEEGATLNFMVAPAWYQKKWFLLLCLVTGAFIVSAAYALRVRQLAKTIHARFDERLAERTRMAREFHDTLLQTIQGSKMVADDALDGATDLARMRAAMERVSGWLGQAMQEGRTALNALRTSITQTNDLAASFQRALDDCRIQGFPEVAFVPEGAAGEMHPIVRDEIYRIGYEAIRNACQHSGANRLEVRLSYSQDLTLSVSDNGKGIASNVAARGKDGHYGLQGMRERATRISGRLSVETSSDSGTTIVLVVPGRIVFRGPRSSWATLLTRMKGLFQGLDDTNSAN
jgi:signal transduction histidine kinase/ligand-binding sensor domain-containing protein